MPQPAVRMATIAEYLRVYRQQELEHTTLGYKTRCPFHEERTASFYLYAEDGHAWCYGGCPEGEKRYSNVLQLIARDQHLSRQEAYAWAWEHGYLSYGEPDPAAGQGVMQPKPVREATPAELMGLRILARQSRIWLKDESIGQRGRDYFLKTRALRGPYRFDLLDRAGYLPNHADLVRGTILPQLARFGEPETLARQIGLTTKEGKLRLWDRVLFFCGEPITYYQARVVQGKRAKFLNPGWSKTPYQPLIRGTLLRSGIRFAPSHCTFLCEGAQDAWAFAQEGYQALATLGSHLPGIETLARLEMPLIDAFDRTDSAGLQASLTLAQLAQDYELPLRRLEFPEGTKDPADWARDFYQHFVTTVFHFTN